MKERPILMSAPMLLATLREIDPKLQTRRVVKMKSHHQIEQRDDGTNWPWMYDGERDGDSWMTCPYGQPGDLLWVRETYFAFGRWETRFSAKKGRDEWHFIDMTMESGMASLYAASGEQPQPMGGKRHLGGVTPTWWKRPAIHMPRVASRITLEVIGVRVERLQDISEADALAEGVRILGSGQMWTAGGVYDAHLHDPKPVGAFCRLWESINGTGSWDANPWVWVVEFKRLEQP